MYNNNMIESEDVKKVVVVAIILTVFILTFFILRPIIISIILGFLFAYIFGPVYKRIRSLFKNKNLSASLLLIGIASIIAIPIITLVPVLIRQASETYILLRSFNLNEFVNNFVGSDILTVLSINFDNIIYKFSSTFQGELTNIIVNSPSLILQFAVFLFTFYFATRDSEELQQYVNTLSPFSKATEQKFMKELRGITNAIIFGQVLIGVAQGLALGAGLFFLGVKNVLVLTFLASLVSMIPVLGSWLVWLPISIALLISGKTFEGMFLFFYGALFISSIDNLLRPYILSRQSNLPIALSLIGTIGGLYFFGIIGLVLGPLTMAYALIIVEFYRQGKLNDLFEK
jgi:predicted PurR-regulated permease PerM